jgi:hypothetical protein
MPMDENPYQSPQTESKPAKLALYLRCSCWIAAWIIAVYILLALLALPMGMIRR